MEKDWCVYLLECMDGSFYTGVTNDIEKRMVAHQNGKGSKYVFARGFKRLLASRKCSDKSEACKQEYLVKQLSRDEKVLWFKN